MSIAAVTHVTTLRGLTLGERSMLFTLAHHSGVKTGIAWPSIAMLANENEISKRATWLILASLEKKGRITREHKGPPGRQITQFRIVGIEIPQGVTAPPEPSFSPPCTVLQAPLNGASGPPEGPFSPIKGSKGVQEPVLERESKAPSLSLEKKVPTSSVPSIVDWRLVANGNGNGRYKPRMTAQVERILNTVACYQETSGPKAALEFAKNSLPPSWVEYLGLKRRIV